jgi:hypothetical protein
MTGSVEYRVKIEISRRCLKYNICWDLISYSQISYATDVSVNIIETMYKMGFCWNEVAKENEQIKYLKLKNYQYRQSYVQLLTPEINNQS